VPEMTFVVTAHCMFLQFSYCKQSVIENVISMASYYIKNQHRTYVTLNSRKDNFINKVHGTSYAPHKKTAGNLNTSVPTSNVLYQILTPFSKTVSK